LTISSCSRDKPTTRQPRQTLIRRPDQKKPAIAEQIGLFLADHDPAGASPSMPAVCTDSRSLFPGRHVFARTYRLFDCQSRHDGRLYHRMADPINPFQARPIVQYTLLILGAIAGMGVAREVGARSHAIIITHSDNGNTIFTQPSYSGPALRASPWPHCDAGQTSHMGWMFRYEPIKVQCEKRAKVTRHTAPLALVCA